MNPLTSLNAPVGTAVVGYGYWGVNLCRNVAGAAGSRLVGVADESPERRDQAVAVHPGTKVWRSLDDVLDDPAVEAVVLATPASTHGRLARRVLEAGRHVLVEKPMAMDVEEAQAILDTATDGQLIAMVGHTFLYSPPVAYVRECIERGDLGTLRYLYSQRLSLGRIRPDCNVLWNLGPHDVALLLHLLADRPVAVSSQGFSFLQTDIDDVSFASLQFESGVGANLHLSWIDPRKVRLLTVVGDDGMLVYDDVAVDRKVHLYDSVATRVDQEEYAQYTSMSEFQWTTRAGDIRVPKIGMSEPLRNEIEAFAESCRSGVPPLSDAEHGLAVVKVLCAIEESARRRGAEVELTW